jgi:hypothetical protein
MFVLKGCPKCGGDLAADVSAPRAELDTDASCIQCGYRLKPEEERGLLHRLLPASSGQTTVAPVYARQI